MFESRRLLLDTNIYGLLFTSSDNLWIPEAIQQKHLVVCGSAVIRQELRNIPKNVKANEEKLRNVTLGLYDAFVGEKRNYSVTEFIERLAEKYSENYRGRYSFEEMKSDFLIIATASLHNTDIVVSNDERTMTSKEAEQAYRITNEKFELRTPNFINLDEFKKILR